MDRPTMIRQTESLPQGVPSGTSSLSDDERSAASISKSFVRRINTPSPSLPSATDVSTSDQGSISLNIMDSDNCERTENSFDIGYRPYSDPQPTPTEHLIPESTSVHDTSMSNTHKQTNGEKVTRICASPVLSQQFEQVNYGDVDSGQKIEFEALLKKETSWWRTCVHKGLTMNLLFLIIMLVSIILGEVFFPLEGVRGEGISFINDTNCINHTAGCITLRIVRAVGVFGFIGGVTNWIAVEILFRSIPYVIGTGVIAKGYKEIRQSICHLVVDTLFDPVGLRQYFTRKKSVRQMLHLESHFGSLLNSDAANRIIEMKINSALKQPEGFILTMMGIDHGELKEMLKRHIHTFISDISPTIQDKMVAPGLRDGIGLQTEVQKILEERIRELSSTKVNQLVAIMIRKHLSWLIVWGNILGAIVGLLAEVITVTVAKYSVN